MKVTYKDGQFLSEGYLSSCSIDNDKCLYELTNDLISISIEINKSPSSRQSWIDGNLHIETLPDDLSLRLLARYLVPSDKPDLVYSACIGYPLGMDVIVKTVQEKLSHFDCSEALK